MITLLALILFFAVIVILVAGAEIKELMKALEQAEGFIAEEHATRASYDPAYALAAKIVLDDVRVALRMEE